MNNWPPMDQRGPVIAAHDVTAFEADFGYALPDDYRAFLLEVNGGRTADSHCRYLKGVVNQLFCLNEDDEASDLKVRAEWARRDLPSRALLVVGHDDCGGSFLLALDGEHRGEVWLQVDDERPHDANPRVLWHDRRDFSKLANSFTEFMESLGPLK
jgi:SMI1 / KNR4 family (SUKH-1)